MYKSKTDNTVAEVIDTWRVGIWFVKYMVGNQVYVRPRDWFEENYYYV